MKWPLLLAVVLVGTEASAQDAGKKPLPTVERLCGKLEHAEDVPVKGSPNTFETKTRGLRGVSVRLYTAGNNNDQSNLDSAIARTATGHWGNFHLREKQLVAGLYWLVVNPDGHEYKMLIRYEPKRNSSQLCSNSYWQLNDEGNFWKAETIVVD